EQSAAKAFEWRVLAPDGTAHVPYHRVDGPGVGKVQGQIDHSSIGAAIEHLLPVASAILRAINASIRMRAVHVTEHHNIYQVRIPRIDADAGDLPRVAQSDVLPDLARVGGLVDAVAEADLAADVDLACARVEHVGIRRRDGDRADGCDK